MISNTEKPLKVNSTLATLLSELGEECEAVLFLLSQLILAELIGSITHLHVHTENLPDLIGDEILALPDDQ